MTHAIRWSAAVLAGLCWVFLTRLAGDLVAPWALSIPLMAPPVVVAALRLPFRGGLVALALIALLHDAGTGMPFGLTASLALPLHGILYAVRRHIAAASPLTLAALAVALTPAMHLMTGVGIHLATGRPMASDLGGFVVETVLGCIACALAAPWLSGFTLALLRTFGVDTEAEAFVS